MGLEYVKAILSLKEVEMAARCKLHLRSFNNVYFGKNKNTASEPNLTAMQRQPCWIFRTLAYKKVTFILIYSRLMITYYLVNEI